MKKIIIGAVALLASVLPAKASETAYSQTLINQVITTTTSFVLDLNAYGIDAVSFSANVSSATPQTSTFTDGSISTGTIIVASTSALVAQASSDTIAVSNNANLVQSKGTQLIQVSSNGVTGQAGGNILAYSTITINGVSVSSGDYTIGASSNATAISIASAINGKVPNIVAAVSPTGGSTVTLTCVNYGSFCNAYTVTTSTIALLTSTGTTGGKFSGGNDNSFFTLNGAVFTQGGAWSQQDVSSNTAISIAGAINGYAGFTASTQTTTRVLITAPAVGSSGNAYTLTSSTGSLAVGKATFAGGQDNAFLIINGIQLTQGTDWTVTGSSVQVSTAIAAAINANASLAGKVIATAVTACPSNCGVVYATGTINTTGNNYNWFSSTEAALTVSSNSATNTNRLSGGTTASYLVNGTSIIITGHSFATGEEVKYSTNTVTPITNLTNQTSYYVAVIDANTIALATTSAQAIASTGTYIVLASSNSSQTAHTFTLTPLTPSQSAVLTWSQSNDGVNFSTATTTSSNVTIPVNALTTPWGLTTYGYDFGPVAYRYIRLTVTGPGAAGNGGFNTVVTGNGKRYWR